MSTILAPVAGELVSLGDVPDPVFSAQIVGSGVAVEPTNAESVTAVAPVDGKLLKLHPHAYVIVSGDGAGVLVHLGIDTVKLGGEGFTVLVDEGAQLTAGQPVIEFNPRAIRARGLSAIVPVVVMDTPADAISVAPRPVDAGDPLFAWPAA